MTKLRQRLSHQEGFTLIELLIVIVIIGILLAIAVPSYLGFKDRANKRAVQSDLRAALPTAEAYYSDHGSYTGLTLAKMASIDTGLASKVVTVATSSKAGYCLSGTKGGQTWSVHGPGATWFEQPDCTGTGCQRQLARPVPRLRAASFTRSPGTGAAEHRPTYRPTGRGKDSAAGPRTKRRSDGASPPTTDCGDLS